MFDVGKLIEKVHVLEHRHNGTTLGYDGLVLEDQVNGKSNATQWLYCPARGSFTHGHAIDDD